MTKKGSGGFFGLQSLIFWPDRRPLEGRRLWPKNPPDPFLLALVFVSLLAAGCGKKGDPLPPLVKLPVAPPDITAERRGASVDVTLTLPSVNTDGTRPANVERVDVYALTGSPGTAPAVLLKSGTKIGSIQVKAPRDPNQTVDADDPDSDIELPEGPGLDQGATTTIKEDLTASVLRATEAPKSDGDVKRGADRATPLVGAPASPPARVYVAVGLNRRGRPGPISKSVAVPLIPPPGASPQPDVTYNETVITVTWGSAGATRAAPDRDVLPSRALPVSTTALAYNVYAVSPQARDGGTKLTSSPLAESRFEDRRIEWGSERCYAIRTVEMIDRLTVEGDAGPPRCVTLTDTFPPAAPAGLQAIALEGAISLLWDPSGEPDLAGYLVLRRSAPNGPFTTMTVTPIQSANYRDPAPPNVPFGYAVEAVDKAGNVSPMSPVVEETAR